MNEDPSLMVREQLECFERQLSRPARARKSSEMALENRVSLCLHLHDAMDDVEKNWGDRVESGQFPYDLAQAESIQNLFIRWLKVAERIFKDVKRAQAGGRRLANGERLKDAIGFCYQARINIKKVNEDMERLARGEGIRITEETHAIRRRRAS